MKPEDGEDFGNDFMDMPRIKALRRGIFIQRALMKFTACLNFQACRGNPASEYVIDETHPHYIAAPQKILGSYLKFRHRIKDLVVHGENNRFIDRHKIIAGKQAAIMALSPLRIKNTRLSPMTVFPNGVRHADRANCSIRQRSPRLRLPL